MNITFEELRSIKHKLPTGSISKIAQQLNIPEQEVRNYFGAKKFTEETKLNGLHREQGPSGGIVSLPNENILTLAKQIISQSNLS